VSNNGVSDQGLVDKYGNEIIPLGKYDSIRTLSGGMVAVQRGNNWALIDIADGRYVIPFGAYDYELQMHRNDMLVLCQNGVIGVKSIDGREIISFGRYDMIRDITDDGLFVVGNRGGEGDAWGVVDANGTEIIPFDRYLIVDIRGDMILLMLEEWPDADIEGCGFGGTINWGVIDTDGNEVIPMGRYVEIYLINGAAAVSSRDNGLWGIVQFNR